MRHLTSKLMVLMVGLIFLASVTGVLATWEYATAAPGLENESSFELGAFSYLPGTGDLVTGEVSVTERFVEEINKDNTQTIIHQLIADRKAKGSGWASINELAADDPNAEGIKELLGIDKYPDLTVVIKFLDDVPSYELYTTRVDIDAVDENGNFIITDDDINNETTYIYPVNRTTFTVLADGTYEAKDVTVGYSRAIWYYETPTQKTDMRTFDVTLWNEGKDIATAVQLEDSVLGNEVTVQNIDQQKVAYFKFTVGYFNTGTYTVRCNTPGLTAQILKSNGTAATGRLSRGTYYVKLTYTTTGEPEDFKFTLSRN